jgi:hypothetical protein
MRKFLEITLIFLLTLLGCRAMQSDKEKTITESGVEPIVINEKINIHYTGQLCDECHEKTPVEGGDPYLKFNGDYNQLCRCHHGMSPGYCHPLEIEPGQDKKFNIPAGFPVEGGKFTCNTCHDVYKQCQKRLFDRQSLRGTPYLHKVDFCYRCHNKENYKELDAHRQINAEKEIVVNMCLYCHEKKPDEKTATYKDVTFIGDLTSLCQRCHIIDGNHAGNFDHIGVIPSAESLNRMEAMTEEYHIILPLSEDGKMTCITCHNPHQKGVLEEDKPSAKGADSKYRHRLPGKLCIACHQK